MVLSTSGNDKANFISGLISGGGSFMLKVIINLAIVPLVIRYLGVEDFGFYVFLINASEMLVTMDAGLTTGLIHRLTHYHSLGNTAKVKEQLGIGLSLYGLIIVLMLAVGFALYPYIPGMFHLGPRQASIASMAIILVLADAAFNLIACYFQSVLKSHSQYKRTNIVESIQTLLSAFLTVAVVMMNQGLIPILLTRLAVSGGAMLILLFQAAQAEPLLRRTRPSFSLAGIRDLFSISFFAMIQRLSAMLAHRIDGFVIAAFLSMADVGLYGLVLRIFSYISGFATKLLEGMFPIFTRMATLSTREKSRFFFLRTSSLINFLAGMMVIGVMGNFPSLIQFLGTGKIHFESAVFPALIIAGITWSGALQMPAGNYLFASGWHRFMTFSSLITALINFGLSIYLVQKIGIVGVALGTLIPNGIQHQVVTIGLACRKLGVSWGEYFYQVHGRNLMAFASSILIYYILRVYAGPGVVNLGLLLAANVLVTVISIACWYTMATTAYEREIIQGLLAKVGKLRPASQKSEPLAEKKNSAAIASLNTDLSRAAEKMDDATETPLVSIIMPTYNNGPYLAEAIQSVLDQTYPHFELIIINDASTDNTDDIISRYFNDPRIRYIKNAVSSGGPSPVRNAGLKKAHGDFIAFLDADDKYKKDCLEMLMAPLLKNPSLTASMAFPHYCDADLNPLHPSRHLTTLPDGRVTFHPDYKLDWKNICAWRISFFLCSTMFRKEAITQIGLLDEALTNGEDFVYHIKLLQLGFERVHVIPATNYFYRNNVGSVTKNPHSLVKSVDSHIKIAEWLFAQKEIPAQLRYLKAYHISYRLSAVVMILAKMNEKRLALHVAFKALAHPDISLAVWMQCFGKQMIRIAMPYSIMQMYSRRFSKDFHLYNQQQTRPSKTKFAEVTADKDAELREADAETDETDLACIAFMDAEAARYKKLLSSI